MNFDAVAQTVDAWVHDGVVPGVSIAIVHKGALVATHQVGLADADRPVDRQTMFAMASLSKPITSAAFMALVDDGSVSLDDTVTDVVPSFGQFDDPLDPDIQPHLEMARDSITFRQLLCHVAGLPELLTTKRSDPLTLPTLEEQVDAMMQVPLRSAPGERLRYSNLGNGIVGRAIEQLTGQGVHQVIRQRVLDPLGLDDIQLTPGPAYDNQIAIVADPANAGTPAESYNTRWWRDNGITWGGYFGSPEAMLRFASAFLPEGPRLLSDDAVRQMTTDQTGGLVGGVESMGAIWNPGAWGIGWEVRGSKPRHWTGNLASPKTFCHFGQAGTLMWVDPLRNLMVAVFANKTVRTMWPLRPARWAALSDAICEVADASSTSR